MVIFLDYRRPHQVSSVQPSLTHPSIHTSIHTYIYLCITHNRVYAAKVVAEAGQHVRKLVLCAILTNQVCACACL